jgi:hypothetical protein
MPDNRAVHLRLSSGRYACGQRYGQISSHNDFDKVTCMACGMSHIGRLAAEAWDLRRKLAQCYETMQLQTRAMRALTEAGHVG